MTDPGRLDRLLDLRRHEEERRTLELVMAHQAVSDAEEALTKLRAQRREVEVTLERVRGESVGQVQTLRLLLEQLDQGIQNASTVMALATATAKEKAVALAKASRDREALERVVIPRRERARAVQRVAEQKLEDEAALAQFRREGGLTS